MSRRRDGQLMVYLNGVQVGQLSRKASRAIEFQYDLSWLASESPLPVSLSLPLREQAYAGASVIAFFENLLPDNDTIRTKIAARARAEGTDAYSLLSAIGHDCVGALQFLPPGADPGPAGAVDGTPVSRRRIAEILNHLATAPLGMSQDESFRISIAGAQEKTALLFLAGQWQIPQRTTATTHIFKPSIGKLANGIDLTDSVENEYLCLKIVESLGLPTAKAAMATFANRRVLIVERFDRLRTRDQRILRLPQEDFCQVLSVPPALKYESDGGPGMAAILGYLRDSDDPAKDQRNFLKANIVFWLLGATDMHAKNFSIFLSPGGRYRLTPFYDVISAQPSVDAHQIRHKHFRLAMAVGTRRHYNMNYIEPRHFLESAAASGVGAEIVTSILEELRDTTSESVARTLARLPKKFPQRLAESIQSGITKRLRLLAKV